MRGRAGFTLLELMIVLALLAGMAALAWPSFSRTIVSARLRSSASDVRATFARARSLAVAAALERVVTFDLEKGEFGIDNDAVRRLPGAIRLGAAGPGGEPTDRGSVRVRFFPDGSAEEAEISLTAEDGGKLRVTVEPLTGLAAAGT